MSYVSLVNLISHLQLRTTVNESETKKSDINIVLFLLYLYTKLCSQVHMTLNIIIYVTQQQNYYAEDVLKQKKKASYKQRASKYNIVLFYRTETLRPIN